MKPLTDRRRAELLEETRDRDAKIEGEINPVFLSGHGVALVLVDVTENRRFRGDDDHRPRNQRVSVDRDRAASLQGVRMRARSPSQVRCIIDATLEPLIAFPRGFAHSKMGPFHLTQTVQALIRDGSLRVIRGQRGNHNLTISARTE